MNCRLEPVPQNVRFFARCDDFSYPDTPAGKPAAGKNPCPTRLRTNTGTNACATRAKHACPPKTSLRRRRAVPPGRLLCNPERRPWMRIQVPQNIFLPVEIRMALQMFGCLEIDTAGMSHRRRERHVRRHRTVGSLVLHGASGPVLGLPGLRSARREFNVPA